MHLEVARGLAAQAWCTKENEHKVLDLGLVNAFADILLEHTEDQTHETNLFGASKAVAKELDANRGWYREWFIENVSDILMEEYEYSYNESAYCGKVASRIVNALFPKEETDG